MGLEKFKMMPKRYASKSLLEVSMIFTQLYFAIPIGLALFPRVGTIKASDLEPEFQNLKTSKGEPATQFAFNKGL